MELVCVSFYLAKHSGRQLSLQPQLGSADLNATFRAAATSPPRSPPAPAAPRRHIIQVSTFQMCVLLLFNKRERLTYEVSCFYLYKPQINATVQFGGIFHFLPQFLPTPISKD